MEISMEVHEKLKIDLSMTCHITLGHISKGE
jgi:hypothetical protein